MFGKEYAKIYDVINCDKNYKADIEFIYEWAGYPKYILDIGCGTAHYWQYYQRNVNIYGIEKSQDMIGLSNYKSKIRSMDVSTMPEFGPELALISKVNGKPISFDLVTMLFDVINYIPQHDWWHYIPLKKGGSLIFDVWDKKLVDKHDFKISIKRVGDVTRIIEPISYDGNVVKLRVNIGDHSEVHTMYVYSHEAIKYFAGSSYTIEERLPTGRWQTWYRLIRK